MTTSVVMATYNGEQFIIEQLNSIVNQSIQPNEIIIVDDHSTDNTLKRINNFILKHHLSITIKLIQNEENLGVVKSFKKGILLAKEDIVILSDQDDVWSKNKIEKLIAVFTIKSDINLIAHAYQVLESTNDKLENMLRPFSNECDVVLSDVLRNNIFPGCTLSFRRLFFNNFVEQITDKVYIHDWFLCLIATYYKSMYYLNSPLIAYRIHNNNTIGLKRRIGFDSNSHKRNNIFQSRGFLLGEVVKHLKTSSKNYPKELNAIYKQKNFYIDRVQMLKEKSIWKLFKLVVVSYSMYDSINSIFADTLLVLNFKK